MQKITLLFFIVLSFTGYAQTVETFEISSPVSCDDLYVDKEGNIYTGKGGLTNKTNLGFVTPDGEVTSVAEGMKGAISIDEAPNGLLYVTNYDDNTIKSYDRETEEVVTVATGLDGPAGIAIDSMGVVYATNWGAFPTYNGHEVHRLFPDGTLEVFKDSPSFSRLQAIAFDDQGYLYVANTQNGRVFKLNTETAEMEILATTNVGILNMEFYGGYLYMAGPGNHKIFRMDLNGEWETFAGTGISGGDDGPVESATFNTPTGIGFSHTGDTLYIADNPNRIRRILFDNVSSTFFAENPMFTGITIGPNPSSGIFNVNMEEWPIGQVKVEVLDLMGRVIQKEEVNSSNFSVDLSGETKGYYFMVLSSGELQRSFRIIVR